MGLTEIKNQFQVNPDYSSGFMPSAFLGMRYADVMTHTWGNVPYPVNYVYDNYGRMTQMNTWRTGTGFDGATFPPGATGLEDSTSWTYQEATGLLLSKTDDNARSVNYTYTTGGRLLTRVWARTPVITTTYSYDANTAELLTVNYSDATPDVTFTYDRLGRPSTVVDGLGTRTFAYNAALAPLTETITGLYSKVITRTYATTGVIGRPTGFNTGAAYSNVWGYDTKGRLNSVNWTITGATAGSATYAYTPNSDLLATRTLGTRVTTYTYEANRDLKSQVRNQVGATTVSQYAYVNDAVGRSTSVVNTGTGFTASAFSLWGYNNRNELTAANRYLGTNITVLTSPVPAETRAFTYDPIGNRTNMTVGTTPGTFTANNLNQYLVQTGPANTFTHDFDGNLSQITGTRNMVLTYDGENRLLSVQPVTPVTNNKRLEFVYDHQGRRVQKLVYNRSAGAAWVLQTTKRFVYDGWNMIEEQTVSAATKYYVYGLDLSQTLQGAGGVGGLLAKAEGAATHNYFYDANGNVSQMVNASGGAITARYEYDAYGNLILATGAQATANPFRFSSKYFDTEYSLYYYGYRYYDPATGRWLSRDPLEEEGGINLYGFVLNAPTDLIDIDGRRIYKPSLNQTGRGLVSRFVGRSVVAVAEPTPIGEILLVGLTIADLVNDFNSNKLYVTYLFFDGCGKVRYAGRTSQGDITFADLERQLQYDIAVSRGARHHIDRTELTSITVDKAAFGRNDDAGAAIRGREQQLIDHFGGAKSDNLDTQLINRVRGVSKTNFLGRFYHKKSNEYFTELHKYTGF